MIPFDKDFVNRCKRGDQKAQKELFEKLYATLYRICLRYIARQTEAEDCLMTAFMKAFQNLEKFEWQNEQSLFFWIRKIVVNQALMELRKQNTLMVVQQEDYHDQPAEENVIDQLSAEELFTLVTELPTGYRTVFNLFVIEGYSHQEIASLTGITESTSKTQLQKAKNRLRTSIEKMNRVYGRHAG